MRLLALAPLFPVLAFAPIEFAAGAARERQADVRARGAGVVPFSLDATRHGQVEIHYRDLP